MKALNTGDYSRMLQGGNTFGGLESLNEPSNLSINKNFVKVYEEQSRADLHRIVKEYLDNNKQLLKVADKIVDQGRGLSQLLENSARDLDSTNLVLEAIVRTDGSRPSFIIKNDKIDFNSSPVGKWRDILAPAENVLSTAIQAVGRLNLPGSGQGFQGTGFLVQDNLIMTNRHVLQAVAMVKNNKWQFYNDAHIDFGHEFRGRSSVNPRKLLKVVFAPKEEIIATSIDHRKTDLVLIEVEKLPAGSNVPKLSVDISDDWADPTLGVVVIGYPGNPGLSAANPLTLLEQLFQSMFGYKRLAPGEIMNKNGTLPPSTTSYDNTTLRGNSGSCVVVLTRTHAAAALHYGGKSSDPRQNWGHVIGRLLQSKDQFSQSTLQECFGHYKVKTINRN